MTTWESLDPEVQRHWLALAEAKHGMPVTWNDVEPARREGLLETVKAELCPDRWEDETPDRQRWLLARFDKLDEQLTRQEHEALKIIIDDLGVDCTPEDPDWRALFLALMRKYGPASARPRGRPPVVGLEALQARQRLCRRAQQTCRCNAKAVHALRQLFSELSSKASAGQRCSKREERSRATVKSLREMLSKAREASCHPRYARR